MSKASAWLALARTSQGAAYTSHVAKEHTQKERGNKNSMTTMINLTPHAIRVRLEASNSTEPLPSDLIYEPYDQNNPARIDSIEQEHGFINEVPLMKLVMGEIYNLPEPQEGVVYIVSMPVAQQIAARGGRVDVVAPHTGPKGGAIRKPGASAPFAVRCFEQF